MCEQAVKQTVDEHPIVADTRDFWQELAMESAQVTYRIKAHSSSLTIEQYEELTARALELSMLMEFAEEMYAKALKTFGGTSYEDKQ